MTSQNICSTQKLVDQDKLNSILNNQNTTTSSDLWKDGPDISIKKMIDCLGPSPKNLLIKIHPTIFNQIGDKFGPLARDFVNPEIFRNKDTFTTFYVTEKASFNEIEIMELPNLIKPIDLYKER